MNVSRRSMLRGAALATSAAVAPKVTAKVIAPRDEFPELPILDEKQSGHLRHFRNILMLPDGEWGAMAGNDPTRAGDHTGFQYQLSGMAHGLAQAFAHRMPAAPGFFRKDMDAAVQKLLHPDVWSYWFAMSQGNPNWNPSLSEPQRPWWDPVVKENIMYSGHLNHVAALYGYLFNDSKYDDVGSIAFQGFQANGFGKGRVEYSLHSLNDTIYWQFVENGFMGVACMPNWVFVTCSQFPLWGLKWQDARLGGSRADDAVASHFNAWRRKGGYAQGKETPFLWMAAQDRLVPQLTPSGDEAGGHDGTFFMSSSWSYWALHAANPQYAASVYDQITAASVGEDDKGRLVVLHEREMAKGADRFGRGADVLATGRRTRAKPYSEKDHRHAGIWGWTSLILSERNDPRLKEILAYADENMNPTWRDGGLFYPRNEQTWEDGRFVGVSPTSGNANFGYARLNVEDGLQKLYNLKWDETHFSQPNLSDVSRDVDVVRARFLPQQNVLVLSLRPPKGSSGGIARLEISNVQRGSQAWTLSLDGDPVAAGDSTSVRHSVLRKTAFEGDKLIIEAPVERISTFALRWT